MTYYNDTDTNVATLARLLSFEPIVARAWLRCEGQEIFNPTNPLNIRYYGRVGQLRGPGFAKYASSTDGLYDAYETIKRLSKLPYGYDKILKQANSGDPIEQAKSIELSAWAAGRYGGTTTRDGCLRRYVRANLPKPVETPLPAEEEIMPTINLKIERWTLDGGPGQVTTLGAPRKGDSTVDWGWRLAYLSGANDTDHRLELIKRSRLTNPDSTMDTKLRLALSTYKVG